MGFDILQLINQGGQGASASEEESGDETYDGTTSSVSSEDTDLSDEEAVAAAAVQSAKKKGSPEAKPVEENPKSPSPEDGSSAGHASEAGDAPVSAIGIPASMLTTKAEKAVSGGGVPGHTDWPSPDDPDAVCEYLRARGPWGPQGGQSDTAVPTLVWNPESRKAVVLIARGTGSELKYDIRVAKPVEIKAATNLIPEIRSAKARGGGARDKPPTSSKKAPAAKSEGEAAAAVGPEKASAAKSEGKAAAAVGPEKEPTPSPKRKRDRLDPGRQSSSEASEDEESVKEVPAPKRPRKEAASDSIVRVSIAYEGAPQIAADDNTTTRQVTRVTSERTLPSTLAFIQFLSERYFMSRPWQSRRSGANFSTLPSATPRRTSRPSPRLLGTLPASSPGSTPTTLSGATSFPNCGQKCGVGLAPARLRPQNPRYDKQRPSLGGWWGLIETCLLCCPDPSLTH